MADLVLMPDVERIFVDWLLTRDTVTDLVQSGVFTEIPKTKPRLMVIASLVGGAPVFSRPLWLDQALIQISTYGGPKVQARQLMDTVRAEIAQNLAGTHDFGVVTGVEFGLLQYLPDDSFDPPRPRFLADVTVYAHPGEETGS